MTEQERRVDKERRIAAAQAARPRVDSQGRPTTEPTKYTYDDRGLLVTAVPASTVEPAPTGEVEPRMPAPNAAQGVSTSPPGLAEQIAEAQRRGDLPQVAYLRWKQQQSAGGWA
jgi:hypothetical protein